MTIALVFILTHLLSDFVFQPRSLVKLKQQGDHRALIYHGLIHFAVGVLLLLAFQSLDLKSLFISLVLSAVHIFVDQAKYRLSKKIQTKLTLVFFVDQAFHLGLIYIASRLYGVIQWGNLLTPQRVLGSMIAIVFTVWTSGIVIGIILDDLRLREDMPESSQPAIGRYIGYLERILIVFFLLSNSITGLGLLATFKTLARFRQLDNQSFSEYYLLGTLLSLSFGILGSYILRMFIY